MSLLECLVAAMCRTLLVAVQGFGVFGANVVFSGHSGKMLNDSWCVFKMSEGIRS